MPLIAALISAIGLVLGSTIGAICSWFITKISLNEQIRLQKEDLDYQEKHKIKEKTINANIIRLDFCNAIYQSIRYLQEYDKLVEFYPIPIYKDYNKVIASLCDYYSLKELSYIYQLYEIIDKSNKVLNSIELLTFKELILARNEFSSILKKIYGADYIKILSKNIDDISYEQLCDDKFMKEGYREILKSLDKICKFKNQSKPK